METFLQICITIELDLVFQLSTLMDMMDCYSTLLKGPFILGTLYTPKPLLHVITN